MNIAIVGFDREGQASFDYYSAAGHSITICDQNADLIAPEGVPTHLGNDYLNDLDAFDLILRTPGLHPNKILAANPAVADKITTGTNEFLRVSPSRNIIGITGTKGKGTTSTLVARILEAAGMRVHLGGNIGVAALNLLKDDVHPDDWVVLELSNYQLIDVKQSPHIAACLMVVPEHLDWHGSEQEYYNAKQQLFRWQSDQDIAVYYPASQHSTDIASAGSAVKIPYMQAPGAVIQDEAIFIDGQMICRLDELKLLGEHNWQNACAATTIVWQVVQDAAAIKSVLTSFAGLPFRIEFRREVNGVRYYNDSFATGPGACIAALRAIKEPKVMILGGHERGLDLTELAEALLEQGDGVRHAVLIGDSKQRLAEVLQAHGFTKFSISHATTMPDIVTDATAAARPGDAVVLSPAFASFDLFKNFEDRGRQFNAAVEAL